MKPNDSEKEFERLVTEHRTTIYTVCYMFSKDADEVADLFQEVLVNLWRGMGGIVGAVAGLVVAVVLVRKMQRTNDELIRQIDEFVAGD